MAGQTVTVGRWCVGLLLALLASAAQAGDIIATPSAVNVPEGGTNTFAVQLSSQPASDVRVSVQWVGGDADITVGTVGLAWGVLAPTSGSFSLPQGVAIDSDSTLYVADTNNNCIRVRDVTGYWTTWGSSGSGLGQFAYPGGVAVDTAGNLYVADTYNHRIQMRTAGGVWSELATQGTAVGQVLFPGGVAVDSSGNLYVADSSNNRLQMRTSLGAWSSLTTALSGPTGVTTSSTYIFVADTGDNRSRRRLLGGGGWTTLTAPTPALSGPCGVATDAAGNLYVADTGNHRLLKWNGSTWTVLATGGSSVGQFAQPWGVAVDAAGNLYVGDRNNNRVQEGVPGLLFTSSNWDTPQTVTLAAAEDPDTLDGVAAVRCEASGWTSADVTATEIDNDLMRVVANVSSVNVPEGGTATVGLSLSQNPGANVTVNTAPLSGDADITVSGGASLTFTAGDWNTPQNVTLAAAQDADAANGTATIEASATGWLSAQVAATEVDNDQIILASAAWIGVPEGGTNTFDVTLAGQPSSDVTVSIARITGDAGLQGVSGLNLTFTPANWNVPQTVTLRDVEDTDVINGSATFRASATGWTSVDVLVGELDNDKRVVVNPTAVSPAEGGTATYAVSLGGQPTGVVQVTTAKTGGDASITATAGLTLTFTPINWNTPQNVTVRAAEDVDAVDGTATFDSTATGWTTGTVTATALDNDRFIVATPNAVNVPEGGTNTFDVVLSGQPAADVAVSVTRTSGDANLYGLAGYNLTFTAANWNVPQTVTLTDSEDVDAINGTAVFSVSASGWTAATVTATEVDNDQILLATPSPIDVPEGGTNTFAVVLAAQPNVTVQVGVARISGDADLAGIAGTVLTFTPANWNVPQNVTIRAAEDVDGYNGSATFRASAAGWVAADVVANEVDNDRGIVVSQSSLRVLEGSTNTVNVSLAGRPDTNVTVHAVRLSGDADLVGTGGVTMVFTPGNWNVPQVFTITANQDADLFNGSAVFRLGAPTWTSADVAASEIDDDVPTILTSVPTLTVPEGGTNTFTVRLCLAPASNVTVTLARLSGDADLAGIAGVALTFTPANWNVPQTVTLRAAADADTLNGSAVFRASAPGWISADVTATEADSGPSSVSAWRLPGS